MARYLLVRGVQDRLVANPRGVDTRRFLGKKPNGVFWGAGPIDPETNAPRWPAAVPCEEVVEDDVSIQKARRNGDIEILRTCAAESLAEATLKFAAPEPPKKAQTRAEVK